MYQHRHYVRTGHRSWRNTAHVWLGRLLLILGIINGGLGLQLAANSTTGQKGIYIAFAAATGLAYAAALMWWILRGRKSSTAANQLGDMRLKENEAQKTEVLRQ
jgi:hypothetical protein